LTGRIGAVMAAGVVAVAVGLVLVLADSKPRQAGTNYVTEVEPVATIAGSGSRCVPDQVIPGDAGALRLLVGTYGDPRPGLGVRVRADGRVLTSGRLASGGPEGHVDVPIERVPRLRDGATVCVSVEGEPGTRTVLYGAAGTLRFEWLRPGNESWFELLGTAAHRFGLGRALLTGPWVLPLVALLLAGAWLAALRLTLRELSR
jgi:hypothetical protein